MNPTIISVNRPEGADQRHLLAHRPDSVFE